MDKILGIGKFGCAVADEFSEYPEYRVYKIDDVLSEKGTLSVEKFSSMDEYEDNFEELEAEIYLRSIRKDDHVLIVVEGGSPISGICLRVAQVISEAKVSILYICPDREIISNTQKRDDQIAFNVIQEYGRSGALESIYLAHRPLIETMVGDVAIAEYEKSLCRSLAYVVSMVNYFEHTEPALTTATEISKTARIKTLGISSFGGDREQQMVFLYPLKGAVDMHFLYGVPSVSLEEDPAMFGKIKKHISGFTSEGLSTTYSVFASDLEDPMVFCSVSSDIIQSFPS